MTKITRRSFLFRVGSTAGLAGLVGPGDLFSQTQPFFGQEIEVTPVEDLMREHGLLRRVLLIYREWVERLEANKPEQVETLAESTRIISSFVENYHERLEEEYLFPRFRKAGKQADLVDVLLQQHQAGRRLTEEALKLANSQSLTIPTNRKQLSRFLGDFIRMYEPHAAREDTVLFPALHGILSADEYDDLGDLFETRETELFGRQGFERMVSMVASVEKRLGIYDLSRFTPRP